MENGSSQTTVDQPPVRKKGCTINSITLGNKQKIIRECFLGCGRKFRTTVGGPHICPICTQILRNSPPLPKEYRVFPPQKALKGLNSID